MSECLEFSKSMTGSTNSGPLQPRKDSLPLPARSSPFEHSATPTSPTRRDHRQRKMTLTSANGQPIQLTPLWEHVVRTRKFPTEVDTRLTFLEISERLRDPEWEVRQHALRVLIDVLPTLNADIVDKVMQPVVPELVNNLGHPAPAVRKGALDAFRVFLIHSRDRENTIKNILQDGLNRSEVRDSFQTNVTTGVILSVPSLLFPSSSSPSPDPKLVKDATIALASRLAQVPHQEAVLKSLLKIRDAVGTEEFGNYLEDYDNKLKRNIEILSKIYNIKTNKRVQRKIGADVKSIQKDKDQDTKWESDSDTSGIAEEEDEVNNGVMPAGRVVLETEIKFNEETAITMTILEEKEDSEKEQDEESGTDVRNDADGKDSSPGRRKTPRRVHFGGEIVKLRTPDSDDMESIEATPKTRIPVPVSPATKMPNTRGRPSSQPCSPRREVGKPRRTSRSVSSSPKREVYTHNAALSPKKSILTRTSSPVLVADRPVEQTRKKSRQEEKERNVSSNEQTVESTGGNVSRSFEPAGRTEEAKKEDVKLLQSGQKIVNSSNRLLDSETSGSSKTGKQGGDNGDQAKKIVSEVKGEQYFGAQSKKNVEAKATLSENIRKADSTFGFAVKNAKNEANRAKVDQDIDDGVFGEDSRVHGDEIAEKDVVDRQLKNVDGDKMSRSDRDKTSVIEKNGNAVRDGENTPEEPSWEELGLVDQEVLEDLHNKEDWRARVRGLERVASALRTSSALIAIEPRLGSLLHAVLGCERSCRVAAAGLAVAKVVVAGVSEEALKKRLPQLAWGLARQGGPSAAQLARITMLRLRPALLLEQLLQPQCLNARNAKTRENTLQLLIFSLVTFPSTEFKVDTVANKVAKMVRDRRRRVRQAALDTLAVLAQIYESEEVLAAGKRAAEGYHDGEAMISAIRARLSRKSLPLVSADGLVMYGLQISPTVQIATDSINLTGPDVDWIVAGSGSVSPGIGRTKGQVIATRSEKERLARSGNTSNYENPWIERPNFVALGVGVRSKPEQPVVWQIVPQNQDLQCEDQLTLQTTRSVNTDIRNASSFKLRNQRRIPASARESTNYRNIAEENFEEREIGNKTDSRIPVLFPKDRGSRNHNQDKSESELSNVHSKRRLRDADNSSSDVNSQEENVRTFGTMYHRRKRNQENNTSMHYDSYRSIKNLNNMSIDCNNVLESTNQEFSNDNTRTYRKVVDKDRFSKKADVGTRYTRSSSIERDQRYVPRNVQQQTFVMHDMYSTNVHREGRFVDENSFQQLQTTLTPLTHLYNKIDFNKRTGEINERNDLYRTRFYRRTKDAAAQKVNEAEFISPNVQTNERFPALCNDAPYRRRLRSLSPSQLYHRQQFVRMASNEVHALSMYDIDKAVNEEEYNEKNKHHFSPEERYHVETLNVVEDRFEADEPELSSSDTLDNDCHREVKQDIQDTQDDSDSRSSSPDRQNEDAAFNVISDQTSPSARDTVDFLISLDQKMEPAAEPTIEDDVSKDWSSEEEIKPRIQSRVPSGNSEHLEFHEETQNESEFSTSDEPGRAEGATSAGRRSVLSVSANERVANESLQTSSDILQTEFKEAQTSPSITTGSPKKSSRSSSRNSNDLEASKSPRRNSRSSQKLSFDLENEESADSTEDRAASAVAQPENDGLESAEPNQSRRESKAVESPAISVASRPRSTEVPECVENHVESAVESPENHKNHRFIDESTVNNSLENGDGRDSSSETNTEPGILKIETQPAEPVATVTKRITSKVPRVTGRFRGNAPKGNSEKPEKSKPVVQQCFSQLESKDWEVTMKGLKSLSQIAKQRPEYLDTCAAATISRHLGRQIKSLRSQVARTACLAAGDVFSSQIRGIDQDFDDIAGPLLHRTADTNRFLRADSNAALDLMIEHLPPHKTILVIVQRGASHQNAIVRAATARLLAAIVDRVGPDHIMILPKDVKDKLLNTGARLLTDGNLDARNHAKKMFRCLTQCEAFRKALTDAVPEATLRHIDKTLKTL